MPQCMLWYFTHSPGDLTLGTGGHPHVCETWTQTLCINTQCLTPCYHVPWHLEPRCHVQVVIRSAGHMSPGDPPRVAQEMIKTWAALKHSKP